jgi:two-component system, OmpR family, KDP operon response regulator KdpE
MPVVTLVEDDERIRQSLRIALEERGYAVRAVRTAVEALHHLTAEPGDVVVLDLGLPDLDGRELLKMLRAVSAVPVIIATAHDDEAVIVRTLDLGADEYIVKPFSAAQLEARIRALLRRANADPVAQRINVGELSIDVAKRRASLAGRDLDLTRKEFDLLHHLALKRGAVVTRKELLAEVWRQPFGGEDRTVDVHLSWLRRKLGETAANPRYLRVVRGVGARLVDPQTEPA